MTQVNAGVEPRQQRRADVRQDLPRGRREMVRVALQALNLFVTAIFLLAQRQREAKDRGEALGASSRYVASRPSREGRDDHEDVQIGVPSPTLSPLSMSPRLDIYCPCMRHGR